MTVTESWADEIHLTDPWVAAISPERIEKALAGFPLPFAQSWDFERLTREVQGIANVGRGSPSQGSTAAIEELLCLAAMAKALAGGIKTLGDTAQNAVLFELLRIDLDHPEGARSDYGAIYESKMIDAVQTIYRVLSRAASQTATQPTPSTRWRDKERQDRRVALAMHLCLIFEAAYDTPARANNWHASYGKEHPWPIFFRSVYLELFPEAERLNLTKVLQEAARQMPAWKAMTEALERLGVIRPDDLAE